MKKFYAVRINFDSSNGNDRDSILFSTKEEAREEYYKRVEQAKKDRRYVDETTGKIYETDDYFELYNDAEHWYYEVYLTTEYFYPKRT